VPGAGLGVGGKVRVAARKVAGETCAWR